MEEKKLTDEELKKAFFILRHGSDEGLSAYVKAVLAIENEYNRQKAEIERLTEENGYLKQCADTFLEDCKRERKQAVKDTAKEILYDIKYGFVFSYKAENEAYQDGYDQALEDYDNKLEKLFKDRYGVEVE